MKMDMNVNTENLQFNGTEYYIQNDGWKMCYESEEQYIRCELAARVGKVFACRQFKNVDNEGLQIHYWNALKHQLVRLMQAGTADNVVGVFCTKKGYCFAVVLTESEALAAYEILPDGTLSDVRKHYSVTLNSYDQYETMGEKVRSYIGGACYNGAANSGWDYLVPFATITEK